MGLIVVLLVLGLMVFGVLGVALPVAMAREEKRNAAEGEALVERKDDVLNEAFDGRSAVTYQSTTRTLSPAVVIEGAVNRGYELISNTDMPNGASIRGRDLVFMRRRD